MVWWYGLNLISEDDYYYQSRPKKYLGAFGVVWGVAAAYLKYRYRANPEIFYKTFLFTPFSPVYAISPIVACAWFYKKQQSVHLEIYKRTVGHLSDIQLF
jgi:membrane associated rhomboid family serine protease